LQNEKRVVKYQFFTEMDTEEMFRLTMFIIKN